MVVVVVVVVVVCVCVWGGGGWLGGWLVDREQIKRRTPLHSDSYSTLLSSYYEMPKFGTETYI